MTTATETQEGEDPKAAALARLRAWREENDRRDPYIYAAYLAEATYDEIHQASRVAVNTIRSAIDRQKEAAMKTAVADRLAAYHHPHFVGMHPGEFEGQAVTQWRPFTGGEPRPVWPEAAYDDDSLTGEDRAALSLEYEAARELWAKAVFKRDAGMLVRGTMKAAWEQYSAALAALESAFNAIVTGDDTRWGANTNDWLNTHEAAIRAASKWDDVTHELAKLYKAYEYDVDSFRTQRLEDAITEFGVDTKGWQVYRASDFEYGLSGDQPTQHALLTLIDKQKARLKEIAAVTGKS